jgi:hypothetical protein
MVAEELGPFVEQRLSRQERRAEERQRLKEQKATDQAKSHMRAFQNFVANKARREMKRKEEGQAREQARVERVSAKAKPLYPKKKEEGPNEN